jgi:hypothetical protein
VRKVEARPVPSELGVKTSTRLTSGSRWHYSLAREITLEGIRTVNSLDQRAMDAGCGTSRGGGQ